MLSMTDRRACMVTTRSRLPRAFADQVAEAGVDEGVSLPAAAVTHLLVRLARNIFRHGFSPTDHALKIHTAFATWESCPGPQPGLQWSPLLHYACHPVLCMILPP